MRKADVILTTPKKSVIYAFGSSKAPQEMFAAEDDWRGGKRLKQAYVLDLDGIVLLRTGYTGSRYDRTKVSVADQATELDAAGFYIEDYRARRGVLEKYSHWPLSDEQTAMRDEELAALKQVPLGWEVGGFGLRDVRMLWAEFAIQKSEYWGSIAENERREKERQDRNTFLEGFIRGRLKALDLNDGSGRYDRSDISLPLETVVALLEKVTS